MLLESFGRDHVLHFLNGGWGDLDFSPQTKQHACHFGIERRLYTLYSIPLAFGTLLSDGRKASLLKIIM